MALQTEGDADPAGVPAGAGARRARDAGRAARARAADLAEQEQQRQPASGGSKPVAWRIEDALTGPSTTALGMRSSRCPCCWSARQGGQADLAGACWTSTTSNRSTTRSAMAPAIRRCRRSRSCCGVSCAARTCGAGRRREEFMLSSSAFRPSRAGHCERLARRDRQPRLGRTGGGLAGHRLHRPAAGEPPAKPSPPGRNRRPGALLAKHAGRNRVQFMAC